MDSTEPTQPQTPEDRDAQIKRDIIAGLLSGGAQMRPTPAFDFEEATPDVAAQADPSLLTGKDVYEYMQTNRKARFSNDEMGRKSFRMMMEYMDTKKTDFIGAAENAVSQMIEELGGLADAPLNPAKFGASVAEGAAKGAQDMYGIFAQSEDPGSWGFKLKSYFQRLAGNDNGDTDSQIRQFHEARDFNNRSYEHMEGKGTILGDYLPEGWKSTYEGLVDAKFATALSYAVLDIPEWFFSAGASTPATALKLAASGAAKSAKATWAARAVERLGGYGTNLIGKGMDVAAGKTLEAAGAVIRAPFKAIYGAEAAAMQMAGDYAGNAVRNATTAAAVEMGAEVIGSSVRHPAMGFMRSIGLEALGELAQTAGADIVDRALGKAMVKNDAIGMTTLERLASGTARGAETMSREAQLLAVGMNASVGWATSMSSSALKAMFRDGVIGAGIGYVNSREEGAGAGVGMGVAWGGLSGTVRHMGAYTRFQHQDQLVVDNFKTYGIEAFRRVLGPTGYESAKRFSEHIQGYGDLRTSAIEMAHLQTLVAHEGQLMGAGNVNFYFGDVSKNPGELMQVLVDMKMPAHHIEQTLRDASMSAGVMSDFKDANLANKKVLIFNSEKYRPHTGRHEVAHLLLRSVAEANGDMELIQDPQGARFKIFRPNYLINLLGASKDMGAMPDKAWNSMIQSYHALLAHTRGADEATAKAEGARMSNHVEVFRELYSKGQLNLQDPMVAKLVADISLVAEEAFAYYHGGLSNVLPVDQYTKDPAARNMLRAWAENRAARKNSLIMADLEMAGVEIKARLTNPDGSPKIYSNEVDANGVPVPVFDAFLFDDGKMLRTPGMDSWIDMVMRQAYSKGEVLTSTMDPFRQEALAKSAGKTHLFNSVAGGGMRLKSPKELDELSSEQANKILGAAGSVPEDVRPLIEVDQEGSTKIKLESISGEALEAVKQSGAFTKQEWDAITGMINIVQRNRQGAMHHNVLNATLLAHTMQVRKGASVIRLTGKEVPVTYRSFVPLSVEVYVKTHDAQGNPLRSPKGGVLIHSLDVAAENRRLQKVFRRADVQQLFGGDFEKFVKTFNAYVVNQSGLNGARVPTAELLKPIFGAESERVRDILYEAFGGRKTKDSAWINEPANGYRGGADDPNRPFFTMRYDTMADIQVQPTAWNPYSHIPFFPYIHNIAYEGVTKNFQLSGFSASPLANGGMMYRSRQGFEIFESKKGYSLFDPFGIKVGVFKTAAKAMKKAARDAGELDEADTIPDNAIYDNNPHVEHPDEVTELTSTFMASGRSEGGKFKGGRSRIGTTPVEMVALLGRTSAHGGFNVGVEPAPGGFPAAALHGAGLIDIHITGPDGQTIIDKAQPMVHFRYSELFGYDVMKAANMPSEDPLISASRDVRTTAIGAMSSNAALSFSPSYIRSLVNTFGKDFASDVFNSRAESALLVSSAVRNGSIPIPVSGGVDGARHAMAIAGLMADRSASALRDKSPTNYHEAKVDSFVGSEQNDILVDMANRIKIGQAGGYSSANVGKLKSVSANKSFLSSALSIRATFGTLDWANRVIKSAEAGVPRSDVEIAAARAILATVTGKLGSPVPTKNIDFLRAYSEAQRTYGTEQNEHQVGGPLAGMWRFRSPDNPDRVVMFQDAMIDLSASDARSEGKRDYKAVAKVIRDIESHHYKFLETAKAESIKDPSTIGPWDPYSVRTSWISGLDEHIPGLSYAVTEVMTELSKPAYKASSKAQVFLDAWHDSAKRVAQNGGVFKKTAVGLFGPDGKFEKNAAGAKKAFAWMEMSNVDDPDVENVLTHRSVYEGIQDAIERHKAGDPSALGDAAILYGTISTLASDGNPFFHLIKPMGERVVGGEPALDILNRSVFESEKKSIGKKGGMGSIPGMGAKVTRPSSIYDLPASRSYLTNTAPSGLPMGRIYVQAGVNSADPARYKSAAKANAVIGSAVSPVVVTTRGTKNMPSQISMVVDNGASTQQLASGQKTLGMLTMPPDTLGAGNLRAEGIAMDLSGSSYSPAHLSIAMRSMDAAGNFDFSRQVSKVDKDMVKWFEAKSSLGSSSAQAVGQMMAGVRKSLAEAGDNSESIGTVYANLTKALVESGVSHEQAMHAERMITSRIQIEDAITSGRVNGPEVLAGLSSIADAMMHSGEVSAGDSAVNGVTKKAISSYAKMVKEYKKAGSIELGSMASTPNSTIDSDSRFMLVGRKAEAHLSRERREILVGLGLMGKLRDASGREHTYFEISDSRASLNTATFGSGLAGALAEGLPDVASALEGAVLARIGQGSKVDLESLMDNFNSRNLKLKDIIVHDELFALYPEVAKLEVRCIEGMGCAYDPTGAKGFVIGVDNFLRHEYAAGIDITSTAPRAGESLMHEGHGSFPDYETNFRDVVLHEIQHAIQNAEDWRDAAFNAPVGRMASSPGLDAPKFVDAKNPSGYLTPMYVGAAKALGSNEDIGIMGPFEDDGTITSDVVRILKKHFHEYDKLANIIVRNTGTAGMREAIGYAASEDVVRAINAIVDAPISKALVADEIPAIVRISERFDTIIDLMELALSKRASEFDAGGMASIKAKLRINRDAVKKIKATALASLERVKQGSDPLVEASALSGVVQTFMPHVGITDPSMSVLARDVIGKIDYVTHMQEMATIPLSRSISKLVYAANNKAGSISPHQANLRIAEVVHGLMKTLYMQDPMEIMARETEFRATMAPEQLAQTPRRSFEDIVKMPEALRVGLFTREMVGAEMGMNMSPGMFGDFKNDNLLMIGGSKGSSKLSSEVFTKDSRMYELGLRYLARASLLTHQIKPDAIIKRVNALAYQSRGWKIDENGKAVYVISEGTMNLKMPGANAKDVSYTLQNMLQDTIGEPRRDNPIQGAGNQMADRTYKQQLEQNRASQFSVLSGIANMDGTETPNLNDIQDMGRGFDKVMASSYMRDVNDLGDDVAFFAAGLTKDGVSVTIQDLAQAIGAAINIESEMTMGSPALDAIMSRNFPEFIRGDDLVTALAQAGVDEDSIRASKAKNIAEAFAGKRISKAEIADIMAVMHEVPFFDSVGAVTNRDQIRNAAFSSDPDAAAKIRAAYFDTGSMGDLMRSTIHKLLNSSAGFSGDAPMKGIFDVVTKHTYGEGMLRLQTVVTSAIKENWNIIEGIKGMTGSKSVAEKLFIRLKDRKPSLRDVFPDRHSDHVMFAKQTGIYPGTVNTDALGDEMMGRFKTRLFKHIMAVTPLAERVAELMGNDSDRSMVIDMLEHIYGSVIDETMNDLSRMTQSADVDDISRTDVMLGTIGAAASIGVRTYGMGSKEVDLVHKNINRTMGGLTSSRMSGVIPFFGVFGGAAHLMRQSARIDSSFVGVAGVAMQGNGPFGPASGRQANMLSQGTAGDTMFRRVMEGRNLEELTEIDVAEEGPDVIDRGDMAAIGLLMNSISQNLNDPSRDRVPAKSELIASALRSHRRLRDIAKGVLEAVNAHAKYMGLGSSLTPSRLISSGSDAYLSDKTRTMIARAVADDHVGLELAQSHIGEQRDKATALFRLMSDIEEDPGISQPFGLLLTDGFKGEYDNPSDLINFRMLPHVTTLRSYVPQEGGKRLVITSAHEALISTATERDVSILTGLDTTSSASPAFASGKYAAMDYNVSANLFGDAHGEQIGSALGRLSPVLARVIGHFDQLQYADMIQKVMMRLSGDQHNSYKHSSKTRSMVHLASGSVGLYYAAENMLLNSDPKIRALGEALKSIDPEGFPNQKNHLALGLMVGTMVPLLKRLSDQESLHEAKQPLMQLVQSWAAKKATGQGRDMREFLTEAGILFSGSSGIGIRRLSQYLAIKFSDADWQGMGRAAGAYVFDASIAPELSKRFDKAEMEIIRAQYMSSLATSKSDTQAYSAYHMNKAMVDTSSRGTSHRITNEMLTGSYPNNAPATKEALGSVHLIQGIVDSILGHSDYGLGTEMFMATLAELTEMDGVLHKPAVVAGDDGFKIHHSAYSQNPDASSRNLPYGGLVSDEIYADTNSGFQPATGATIAGPGSLFTTGEVVAAAHGGMAMAFMMFPESKEYMSGVKSRGASVTTTFNPGKNNKLTKDLVRAHLRRTIAKRVAAAGTDVIEIQPASMSLSYRAPSAALLIGMRGRETMREAVIDWHGTGIRSIDKTIQYKTGGQHGNYITAGNTASLVEGMYGDLTGFAESKPSRGFSWSRAANGDILVNISGDHLGYKMDGRAYGKRVGFGFSIAEGVGYDPNNNVLIPAKAQMQAGMHQILSSYGHFMVDAFDPNGAGIAAAYQRADQSLGGRVHRSRLDAVTAKDLKEVQASVKGALRLIREDDELAAHMSPAQRLSFGQPASYMTLRIPAGANMETIKQMLLTAHMDPTITPNYGILGRAGRFEGAILSSHAGALFGNYGDHTGSYSRSIKHKIRSSQNNVIDSSTPADVLMSQLALTRQNVDPHIIDDIELLVARIVGGESGYFLPDAERKLALDGDTGMAIATLFPGRQDLLKYSWDAKAMHGIKVWKRTAPKGDANFRAHVVQFDSPVGITPEGGLQISKTAFAFKTAAEAEQYANRVSRTMSGAEMVKALADGELEIVDRPDLSKSSDEFIGDLRPTKLSVFGDEGLVESANGYTVGDLDMVFDQKTASKVSKALDTRKHVQFRAARDLLMVGGRKLDELDALVKSKLNFGLPKGPIAFGSRAMNAISKGVDQHKRYKDSMNGADWFAFMKTNGVSGEEIRQSGLGQLFSSSMDTPLSRMDVAEFFAAMMPNLVKNDFKFGSHQRAVEAMTMEIPMNAGSNIPAFVSKSGWHLPYIQNAAIQSVANMKMSVDAVRGPLADLEMRMAEANSRGDAEATAKFAAAIDVIRQSAYAAAERMGVDASTLEGASVVQALDLVDEFLKSRVEGLSSSTSTYSDIGRLARDLDFGDIEKVRQKYNDEVGKLLKDQAMAGALNGIAPEIYAPLRLMRHGWIGATKPELGLVSSSTGSRSSGSAVYSFGSNYSETTGQALGFRNEGWDGYSSGRQQVGTQTVVQFYDAAKQDEINQYMEDLEAAAAAALNAGDNEKHKAATSLLAAAKRVATVRKAMAGLSNGISAHFGDYMPTKSIEPSGGEYEIGHYRYSLNLALAGLSLPIFDRPDALLIGPSAAGLPNQVNLEKLGFPVMMMEEFQSDLFQKFGGTGIVDDVDAFLPATADEAAKMAEVPLIKKLEEQVAKLSAVRDNATKHMLDSLIKVVSDKSFSDLTLRLQLNNLDMMNKMFIAASAPGFFRGSGRYVNTPETLRQSINRQAGFMLPERMLVVEPDVDLIKMVMLANGGQTLTKGSLAAIRDRMLGNISSAQEVHALFNGRGMNIAQIIEGINSQTLRAVSNSYQAVAQLLHKANTDMMSENYLTRVIPSLDNAPDGDLKEMLKGLHSHMENVGQRGTDSQGLLASQLAAIVLLDEKFVLEATKSAQEGTKIDYESAARRALETIRARFADSKSFNGKTVMTSLEIMLQQAAEPKPHMGFSNNFSAGLELGAGDFIQSILHGGTMTAEQLNDIENIPLDRLTTMIGLTTNRRNSALNDIAWQVDSAGDLSKKAIFIERGPGPNDNGPQRSYITIRTEGLSGTQVANRIFLEALRAKRDARSLGDIILTDYDRYSGTQAGSFVRSIAELFKAMVNKENIGPEIDRLKADISARSKGIPEMGEYAGSRKGSDAIMPNALPFVDINGYKSAHLSMAVIDSMNHGMRAIGMYDSTFQLERGHGLEPNPSLYLGVGKNNRFVFKALGNDAEHRVLQAVMYAYEKMDGREMAGPDGPHMGFLHRLNNMEDGEVSRLLSGLTIDHMGVNGTIGAHIAMTFVDMFGRLPEEIKQSVKKANVIVGDEFSVNSSLMKTITSRIDRQAKDKNGSLRGPAYVNGKKVANEYWDQTTFKFNANSVKDSPMTMMPAQAHGSAGWGYVTNYGMPGWKMDLMAVGASKAFKNLYSLDAFERPRFEVRGSNMVLLDPKTGREIVSVDVTTEKGMRIFREKYLQASKYKGGNWAINAFMKEWGAAGGYIDMTTLADLPGYQGGVSGYGLNLDLGMSPAMTALGALTQRGDPMGDAIIQATKQGKLSPAGFGQTAPFGGTPKLTNEERARVLVGAGADFGRSDFGVDDMAMRPGSVIQGQGQLSGSYDGSEINQGDNPRAMPTAQSFLNFGMVHPTVYAAVMGGGSQTPEAIAHTILRIRNPIVATFVHTPEMRTREHEIAFRNKISSGVNLLMASGQRAEPGKPISPELISALAQLADKVQASGEHASRRRSEQVADMRYRDLRDSTPITYADNLMVDRKALPELPMAEKPAEVDPSDRRARLYDRELATELLKQGHSDQEVARHLGVSRTTMVLLRAKEGIAPLPEGSLSKRDTSATNKLTQEEVTKRMDKIAEGLVAGGSYSDLVRKSNLTDSKRKHGGWKPIREYIESKGVSVPKQGGSKPRNKPGKVEPSPSDSLSAPTHEAQVRQAPNQSKLMKREQLEGDMNG